jgi:hypothetical protein
MIPTYRNRKNAFQEYREAIRYIRSLQKENSITQPYLIGYFSLSTLLLIRNTVVERFKNIFSNPLG